MVENICRKMKSKTKEKDEVESIMKPESTENQKNLRKKTINKNCNWDEG
jgi:hypothetical protein